MPALFPLFFFPALLISRVFLTPESGLDHFSFFYGFLYIFLWFSYGFLKVFLGLKFQENKKKTKRKQKENKKKTQENPRKPEEKKTTAPPFQWPLPLWSTYSLDQRFLATSQA